MTGNELIAFVRHQLRERAPKTWEPEDILLALNESKDWAQSFITLYESEYFYTYCTIPTVVGEQAYALPDGTLYSSAPKCNGTVDFIKQPNYEPAFGVDFRRIHDPSSGSVIGGFDIKHKSIWLDIEPGSVFNFKLYYYFLLDNITASDTDIDFIPGCEYFIAWLAIKNSKLMTEDGVEDVAKKCLEWQAVVRGHLGSRIHGGPIKAYGDRDDDFDGIGYD